MSYVQTNRILSRLANLVCALEDAQAFSEAGETTLAHRSMDMARENITAIRQQLDLIEHQLQPVMTLAEVVERAG